MARYRNESEGTYKFTIWGSPGLAPKEYTVAPGEVCDIPDGYAGPFMERRAPGCKRVADDAEALKPSKGIGTSSLAAEAAPEPPAPAPEPESESGEPPAPAPEEEPEAPAASAPAEPQKKSPMADIAREGRKGRKGRKR